MGLIDKLREANLDKDTRIELYMEEGEDVIHCNDDYRHDVVENSGLIDELATLTMHPANSKRFLLKEMRDEGLLDEYERGEFYFDEFVSDSNTIIGSSPNENVITIYNALIKQVTP